MMSTTPARRLTLLAAIAAVLGLAGGGAAWVLVHLIDLITHLALFHTLSTETRSMVGFEAGWPLFAVAVVGLGWVRVRAQPHCDALENIRVDERLGGEGRVEGAHEIASARGSRDGEPLERGTPRHENRRPHLLRDDARDRQALAG